MVHSPIAATVELHVEQGPVLDQAGIPIGVVTAIVAQRRGVIRVHGQANHAGTTPMHLRSDAMVAAARAVLAIRRLGFGPASAATVGRLEVRPGVANVIPGEAELSFDVRAADDGRCDAAIEELHRALGTIGTVTNTTIESEVLTATPAVRTDDRLRDLIARTSRDRGLPWVELPSGAGHDCGHLARLGPVAMIFVPSTDGVSHHRSETSPPDALVAGAAVLLDVLVGADEVLDA